MTSVTEVTEVTGPSKVTDKESSDLPFTEEASQGSLASDRLMGVGV